MTITEDTQAQLLSLLEQFEELERQARLVEAAPDDMLLIVRADGIKATKHFLKDTLDAPDYHKALHNAVIQTYIIWQKWAPEPNWPYLVGALRLSDEVSFIVNRGENYHGRRLYKTTSSLASTLSGSMSLGYSRTVKLARDPVMAFDGRPLVIADAEQLFAYIRCRRLLYARNAMARVLRLKSNLSNAQLYEGRPRLADDIFQLSREIGARTLWAEFRLAAGGGSFYVAEASGHFQGHTLPPDPTDDSVIRQVWTKP